MNQRLNQLMKELGDAISESLAESDQVAAVVSKIKARGYDVCLVLEAARGSNQHEERTTARPSLVTTPRAEPGFNVSAQDVRFLKSLHIRVDDAA